jgi:hypothetical protein
VLRPDDTALFICAPQSRGGGIHNTIQWWINGSRVTNFNPEYVEISIDSLLETGVLLIQNVYNGSTIQCSVNESTEISYSNQLLLLVEG